MSVRSLLLACLALAGCAGSVDPAPPRCDGSARRPANPYGSVLVVPAAAPSTPSAGADAGPAPEAPSSGGCA